MIYLQLFLSFLQIGGLSFGGGYAAMPLIQEQIVNKYHWITMESFADLVTIAEMTPGPIAVNAATFVGIQVGGIPGAIIATSGCILPACIFVTLLAYLYSKYRKLSILQGTLESLRPAVLSMIANAGITILISAFFVNGTVSFVMSNVSLRMILYFAVAIFLLRKIKWNPIFVIVLCGFAEVGYTLLF